MHLLTVVAINVRLHIILEIISYIMKSYGEFKNVLPAFVIILLLLKRILCRWGLDFVPEGQVMLKCI